jgi:threonine/homoserine/homoserine lactone efflux protein
MHLSVLAAFAVALAIAVALPGPGIFAWITVAAQ